MTGMVNDSKEPKGSSAYRIDNDKRHFLTATNLKELGITWEVLQPLLQAFTPNKFDSKDERVFFRSTQEKDGNKSKKILPDGISINGVKFGNYPKEKPTAAELGWITYMVIGEPLIEESANIIPPAADLLSTRSYVNMSDNTNKFEDSVKFSISNTISWSLGGSGALTFGGRASGTLEGQIQKSDQYTFESSAKATHINHAHKDEQGTEDQTEGSAKTSASETTTGIGTASGTGEVFSQLELGVTGSTSGSLMTSWDSTSSVSGDIPSNGRVGTMATQRRQVKNFTYELPITLSGIISLHYPEPVLIDKDYIPPQDPPKSKDSKEKEAEKYSEFIADDIFKLALYGDKKFLSKGIAEVVSSLDVEHIIFKSDVLKSEEYSLKLKRPHNI